MVTRTSTRHTTIVDYISGSHVQGTPEEIGAVQPMARRLVEEYGYSKGQIMTHPQYRIGQSPSDDHGKYPLDIAVFEDDGKSTLRMIVECKRPDAKNGRIQLERYMGLCSAPVGVWSNGNDVDTIVLKRVVRGQKIEYQELPRIPDRNVDLDAELVLFKPDLRPNADLKKVLRGIRARLAAREEGITNDAKFAEEIINLILCKIYDEKETDLDKPLSFVANGTAEETNKRINALFEKVKAAYPDIFSSSDRIELSATSVAWCVGSLERFSFLKSSRDVIGDAFEVFIGPSLRGTKGQYFTPRNVCNLAISLLDPGTNSKIIDPACGSGGFLVSALDYVWGKLAQQKISKGWTDAQFQNHKNEVASTCFFGIDKDRFLTKVCKAYMAIMGDGKGGIYCEDTLNATEDYSPKTRARIENIAFDCVVANPPYGNEILVSEPGILKLYDLGHDYDANGVRRQKLPKSRRPQVLFIEKILGLLKDHGRAAIVLPESLFSNPRDRYIMNYLLTRSTILGIIALPAETFTPSTDVKTCVVLLEKEAPRKDYAIFMAVCRNIGHDRRGRPNQTDDLPAILEKYREFAKTNTIPKREQSENGFVVKFSDLRSQVLTPHTYWYQANDVNSLISSVSLGTLLDAKVIAMVNGKAVPSSSYASSGVPFVRTSDIRNLELSRRTSKYISAADYQRIKGSFDVQHKDLLFAKRGRPSTDKSNGLIGQVAYVMEHQQAITFAGAIARIRVVQPKNTYGITPENLVFLLTEDHVKSQIKVLCGSEDALTGLTEQAMRQLNLNLHTPKELKAIHTQMKALLKHKAGVDQVLCALGR